MPPLTGTRASWRRAAHYALSACVLVALGWLLWRELARDWSQVESFHFTPSVPALALAVALALATSLLETRAWQRTLNAHCATVQVGFLESVALVNTSGLLKYLPGRVWTYGAQMLWLGQRGVERGLVLYVNLLVLLCSTLVSTAFGGAYFLLRHPAPGFMPLLWLLLVVGHLCALLAGPWLIALGFRLFGKLLRREIRIVATSPFLMLELALIYLLVWGLLGVAGYYAGVGVGLRVSWSDVTAITAAMSVAWVVGYLSALTPGGLGVREGLMVLMLRDAVNPQTTFVLPLVTRLLYLAAEITLGALGLAIGLKLGLFKRQEASGPA